MSDPAYWQEAFEYALDGEGLFHLVQQMTAEQRASIGKSLATSHGCFSDYHYTPANPLIDENSRLKRKLAWERDLVKCPTCGGRGRLEYTAGPWFVNSHCDRCNSTGKIHPCGEREPA